MSAVIAASYALCRLRYVALGKREHILVTKQEIRTVTSCVFGMVLG